MNYITKEFKKLTSMAFIIIGAFLMLEHIYSYGGIHLLDFLGHEWLAIVLFTIGTILANKKWSEKLSPIQYAKQKIKSLK